ncbi:MAG: branched-chain amino acid transporter permease [Clostridia bacterium]|jgi:branched-subunit amino acid transport protein AzlD|nr:branched-chain amino acid transporter permease [Clostridia bacterium]MBQ5904322.1 branched-chain amino acid transporter permease [Clostridia bacterium]
MSTNEKIITIVIIFLATIIMRFLPFVAFPENKPTPRFIQYLGKYLPGAVFGLLIVFALKDVTILEGSHGLPELIAIAVTALLHLWKKQMIISISGGTICYMLLVQLVF